MPTQRRIQYDNDFHLRKLLIIGFLAYRPWRASLMKNHYPRIQPHKRYSLLIDEKAD